MATLIEFRTPSGTVLRCDERCHAARRPYCRCICGGAYHGLSYLPGNLKDLVREREPQVIASIHEVVKELQETGSIHIRKKPQSLQLQLTLQPLQETSCPDPNHPESQPGKTDPMEPAF